MLKIPQSGIKEFIYFPRLRISDESQRKEIICGTSERNNIDAIEADHVLHKQVAKE